MRIVTTTALCWLVLTAARAAAPPGTPDEEPVPDATLALERRVELWCPGDCAIAVPFVVEYRTAREHLVFVGVNHSFEEGSPTMRAVDRGFRGIHPRVVILEGFPTAMGENPPPLVAQARQHGRRGADEFTRIEAMHAAARALKDRTPFLGGELTRAEEHAALRARGFTDDEIAFGATAGLYSQALRSGDLRDLSLDSVEAYYPLVVQRMRLPLDHGGHEMDPPSLADFRRRYRELYGVEFIGDPGFPLRMDIGDQSRHGQQRRAFANARDVHLLQVIRQQLDGRREVLVYGGDHWATLSAALERRLGRPAVTPFPR